MGSRYIVAWAAVKARFTLKLMQIEEMLAPELAALDREMGRALGSDHPFLRELSERIMCAPGKRLRPKLLILCAKMLGYRGERAPLYAAVFELIHTATLIHDDIIDDADTRRGQPTLNHDLGKTITVLYGDLLYTKAHSAAIEAGRLDVLADITWVSERMIEGELLQDKHNFDLDLDEATYFDILTRKTAYLFAGTAKAGALIADRTPDECEALFQFGFNFGVSFQLMDDILDYTSSEAAMGKPAFSDLQGGKATLPMLRLLESKPSIRKLVTRLWAGEEGVVEELAAELDAHDGLAEARRLAKNYAERAVSHLDRFPLNEYGAVLRELPLLQLHRIK